jgi:hypothetical protein
MSLDLRTAKEKEKINLFGHGHKAEGDRGEERSGES